MTSTDKIIETLKRKKIELEPGLTDSEIQSVETRFRFRFPPDLRRFLQAVLPVSKPFYHWRKALADAEIAEQIDKMFDWPRDGILFDVEDNSFWVHRDLPGVPAWGPKPASLEEQLDLQRVEIMLYYLKKWGVAQ